MQLSTFLFLCFLLLTFIIYVILPKKIRWAWLLLASYAFCTYRDWRYAAILLGVTLAAWLCGWAIGKSVERKTKKIWLTAGILVVVGVLFVFKYLNFSLLVINDLARMLGGADGFSLLNILLSLGVSFYSFQSISYLLDIYNGVIEPEKNPGKFALYLAFFPKLISGPIERAADLLPQIAAPHKFEYERFVEALIRIFWGFFKKLVIADRLALVVSTYFNAENPAELWGPQVILAAVAFSLQIYIDFSAYCDIAIGSARLFGIDLRENFNLPYLARTVTDFWRRWHITLTKWLTDYIYTPLTFASRKKRSKFYNYLNIFITFLVSGIWHGANYTFIVWGLLHGFYQVIEAATQKLRQKVEKKLAGGFKGFLLAAAQVVVTFGLVTLAWVFFRADDLTYALAMLKNMVTLRGSLHAVAWDFSAIALTPADYWIIAISLVIFFIFEINNRQNDLIARSLGWPLPLRWLAYLILIFGVILFGYFGVFTAQDFIYAGF